MRITQSMMSSSMMRGLQANYSRMNKYQEQALTERRINRPSDDAVGIASALRYRGELGMTEQFEQNVEDADSWMKFNDTMMSEAVKILHTVSEKAVQGTTESINPEARKILSKEIDELYKQLVAIGNSQFKGKYIFNGQMTDQKPFSDDPANTAFTLDDGKMRYQIGAGIYAEVNSLGKDVFGAYQDPADPTKTTNVFKALDNLKKALNNDSTADIEKGITEIQTSMDRIIYAQADVGARQNRLAFTASRLEDLNLNYVDLQSKVEDINVPTTITELKTAEGIYQLSLDTMARIIRPSLMDFLR
ncbi:flagellar hook-associated protein FlgL [Paenibacillus sp. FJAT-26967]|uniref:flagellar hook-associated protein FlgL n=1 Tax=Paenibacillus sp. FJAT-26967 TaxID=1729690 RepID=UPI0008382545|nr:flagellar hook-associated protein FlgL [Paenibacillus sp. FJAT-26967]